MSLSSIFKLSLCGLNFAILMLTGCAHNEPFNQHLDESWNPPTFKEYYKHVRKQTQRQQKYSGFYNQFDLSLTYLTDNILIKQLKLEAHKSQLSPEMANRRLKTLEDSLNHESKFFVSVFTPKSDDNKLDMKSTGWVAILYFDGERFDGHFKATSKSAHSLKLYYPDHNIWSKAFILTFPVPTRELMGKSFQIKFSNPYGEAVFQY